MTSTRGVLVASNDTHVAMFAPVAAALEERGVTSVILSLDAFYRQGATPAATRASLRVVELRGERSGDPGTGFYARPVVAVWRDTIHARRALRRLMLAERPSVVVLGNDHGLIEKAVIHEARSVDARTVLIQDGRLAPRPRLSGPRAALTRAAKRALSPLLRVLGFGYLAASDYGSGGTDLICASGEASAQILAERGARGSRIVVTGQPRYDHLAELPASVDPPFDVVIFTSPFEAAGLGRAAQSAQEALVRDLHRWAADRGRRVGVKPHPREELEAYASVVGSDSVLTGDPSLAMAAGRVAVIGMSTVLDEAAFLGRPVVVPGAVVHGPGMATLLPPREPYPRGDSLSELAALIEQMEEPEARASVVARQAAFARRQVMRDPGSTSAERVVEAILGA